MKEEFLFFGMSISPISGVTMLEPEREKEIRELECMEEGECQICLPCFKIVEARYELLAEIDRLRTEQQILREKLAIAVEAIKHVHKYVNPEFGWGELLAQALEKIRGQ
jgi:hypothetical protein